MVAHLLGLANFAIAFAGIIGTIILYVTAKDDFVRTNARNALNMQITWLIYAIVFFIAYGIVFFTSFFPSMTATHAQVSEPGALRGFAAVVSIMGMLFLGMLVTAILNGIGARRAYLGRVFRYPIAIPFLRDPVFPEPIAAA